MGQPLYDETGKVLGYFLTATEGAEARAILERAGFNSKTSEILAVLSRSDGGPDGDEPTIVSNG